MKKVLITGITGYIGSQLARALLADSGVYGLARQPLNETYLDPEFREKLTLLDYDGSGESVLTALETSQPDIVYHLAACYTPAHDIKTIPRLLESNLTFGTYLLEAMHAVRCRRLVYATTVTTRYTGAEYQPLTLYAATKQAFSDLVEYYAEAGSLKAAALALSDTYGPNDRRPKVLNLIRQSILESKPLDLTSGSQQYDAVYIDDVICGLRQAAAALENALAAHQFYQLSGAEPRTLRDTVELLLQVNNLTFHANWGSRPEPGCMVKSPIHIYPAPPGWEPQISLAEGLRRFWRGTSTE